MFILKKILKDINKYVVIDNDLFTVNFSNEISHKKNTAKLYDSPIDGLVIFNSKVYYNDWEGNFMILGEELKLIDAGIGKAFYFSSAHYLGNQYFEDSKMIDALIDDVDNFIIIGSINKFNNLNFSNKDIYIYIKEDKSLNSYSILERHFLWQFSNLSDFNWMQKSIYEGEPEEERQAEVAKFLGVYKNLLWTVLNRGSLLALDINTGEVKKHIHVGKTKEQTLKTLENPAFSLYSFIDEKVGKIINLFHDFYLEYDLEKLDDFFEYSTYTESTKNFGLELDRIGGYDEEFIYAYEGGINNRFAIFSRTKKEIIWSGEIEEVKGKFPAIRDLQYGADKIYVLDHNNNLHIFEKE